MFARVSAVIAATMLAVGCRDIVSPTPPTAFRPTNPSFAVSGATAEVRGTGTIGTGDTLPGSQRQDFDFDITSDLAGHLTLKDYSVVRSPIQVGKLTVTPTDPATWFAAFRDGSSACADPTHGAEVDGMGRLDNGVLLSFTIFVCDNGAAGSNVDFIRFRSADGGYERSGTLSSGDLVKSGSLAALPADTRISGLGSIGPGTQTVRSNRQDFDFDVNAKPGGRLKYTDWLYPLTTDSGQYVTVDPVNDPATGVTSFYKTSATCVRFGGIGRVNGVSTFPFYIDVCDNASSGTGFDTFTITMPDLDGQGNTYRESGTLSSGDIALSGNSTPPTTGTLNITTSTTGANVDPDGYTVTVDGTTSASIADNGSQSFANLSSGSHSATLSGVAANCTVSGGASQSANVPAGGTTSLAFQVNCVAPPASQLAFSVQPSNATAGSPISPAVQVKALDAAGNVATSFTGTMTIALGANPTGATLSGTVTRSAVNGVATFSDLSLTKAGSGYTLTVAASGLSGATSASFNVAAGSASALVFTVQPSNTETGTSISPAVKVAAFDAYGNAATSFTGSMTMAIGQNPGGGTLSGTKTVTAVNGVATFSDLKIDRAGDGYTLRVAASGTPGAESAQFNVKQKSVICVLGICF